MDVRFATAEPFPLVSVEYVCPCGATAHAYGRTAGSLPPGWVVREPESEADEAVCVCPRCAARGRDD